MTFDERTSFRIRDEELKLIDKLLKNNRIKYLNVSHFIRCAIIRQLKEDGMIL